MEPQKSELEALDNSAKLLKFAAENIKDPKDLPEATVATIATAWQRRSDGSWDADISTKFWQAYATLATLIKPVSLDSLTATAKQVTVRKWLWFGPESQVSIAHRSARRYLALLLMLLVISSVLGFMSSTVLNLSTQIQKLMEGSNSIANEVSEQIDSLLPGFGNDKPLDTATDDKDQRRISILRNRLQALYYYMDRLFETAVVLSNVSLLGSYSYEKGDLSWAPTLSVAKSSLQSYYVTRRDVTEKQQEAVIRANMIAGYVLPIILGAMGACAYVVRLISEQIKDTTYLPSSPIRHLVRIVLGALAGVAIGYGGVVTGTTPTGAALSFIAGYAIEPVFATFDSIAQKFR
jgi:hypothetical protein